MFILPSMATHIELLDRDEAGSDDEATYSQIIRGRVIAVTGAGGSIGRALCRLIVRHNPAKLLMIDSSERSLFEAGLTLDADGMDIRPVIADVRNIEKMKRLLIGVDTVYHCAALKHVGLCERNADEAVLTNVEGSWVVHEAARATGALPVLISTDKAVEPVGVMGITKAAAEGIWGGPVVRLVNVLWSSGSLLPIVAERLVLGQPITIRGENTTRLFVTEAEAARAILSAYSYRGVTVSVTGGPMKIIDLVHRLAAVMDRPVHIVEAPLAEFEKRHEAVKWPFETLDAAGPLTSVSLPVSGKRIVEWRHMNAMIDMARVSHEKAREAVKHFATTVLT